MGTVSSPWVSEDIKIHFPWGILCIKSYEVANKKTIGFFTFKTVSVSPERPVAIHIIQPGLSKPLSLEISPSIFVPPANFFQSSSLSKKKVSYLTGGELTSVLLCL